ncbi:LOW QUALITY PROTEIN: cysteine-rich and transmembrane domain-containing protein 1-like [Carcharodon carcharias]|uniref:LOW QUALITY PROTEIN: cysteine-rich and transmembrane domain-containing protein 1-like n=1 Tax=Carcharodon carcharias TaxID=13397 RepID=UPI001B7E01AB|nr:LOW QUALITY PROTEIN: cysteine-rich and transmembrane domain-containing protein 1-like [Carcharodon carcharias]
MNKNPPSYPEPGPTGPYPAYPQHHGTGPNAAYPGYPPPPGGQPVHQGYPQYGWQNVPPQPEWFTQVLQKSTVYVVEDRRREDTGDTCLTACWTALCCSCLWDMLT